MTCIKNRRAIKTNLMAVQTRLYEIITNPSQELFDVFISDNSKKLVLTWYLIPDSNRKQTFMKVDGDEQRILNALVSLDKRKLFVSVEFLQQDDSRPRHIVMTLNELVNPNLRELNISQCDVQTQVNNARNSKSPNQIHFCYTQTYHDLNS